MKQYGPRFATEFYTKDLSKVYRLAKEGELKVERWAMSRMYNLADYYGFDDDRSVATEESLIFSIIRAESVEEMQNAVDFYSQFIFKDFTQKYQNKLNRELVH